MTRVAIAAPGFSADCLETIEELGIRGEEDFIAAVEAGSALAGSKMRYPNSIET